MPSESKHYTVCAHGSLKRKCEVCERDAEVAALSAEIEAWQEASGLCVPAEEKGGDPGGVRPKHLAAYLEEVEKERDEARAALAELLLTCRAGHVRAEVLLAEQGARREAESALAAERAAREADKKEHAADLAGMAATGDGLAERVVEEQSAKWAAEARAEKAERVLAVERECREAGAAKCDARTERLSVAEAALAVAEMDLGVQNEQESNEHAARLRAEARVAALEGAIKRKDAALFLAGNACNWTGPVGRAIDAALTPAQAREVSGNPGELNALRSALDSTKEGA